MIELEKTLLNGITKLTFRLTNARHLEVLVLEVPSTYGSIALMDERVYVFKDRETHEVVAELERYARERDPNILLGDLWSEIDMLLEGDLDADVVIRW